MLASHCGLWTSTGSDEMSVFQMLSDGNTGQFAAPGTGVPARAGDDSNVADALHSTRTDKDNAATGPERDRALDRRCDRPCDRRPDPGAARRSVVARMPT